MANNNLPTSVRDRNQLSAEEFQRKLYNWFEDRGLLSDLRAHLRRQMIIALRDTALSTHSANSSRQTASPKLQAINLLVAEFLLQQEYHYTLSVFTSEVPLLRNLPEFTTSINSNVITRRNSRSPDEILPRFQQRDVLDILEAIGLSPNSEEGVKVHERYQNSQGESLFTCIIRSLPGTLHFKSKPEKTTTSLLNDEVQQQKRNDSPITELTLSRFEMFTKEMRAILLQSSLRSHDIAHLHEELRRLVEAEVSQVREDEESRFQQQLVDRERRIQAELARHEDDIQQKLTDAEQRLASQRLAIDEDLDLKQRQLTELAAQLHLHQAEVTCRLRNVEERNKVLKKREKHLKELKEQEAAKLDTKSSELELKKKQLDEEMKRLSEEKHTRDIVRRELEDSRQKLIDASRALGESQSEVAFLRELQSKCALLHYVQEQPGTSSTPDQARLESVHDVEREKHETTEKDQQTQTENTSLCLEQLNRAHEIQQSQQDLVDDLLQQLQQDNSELRGHTQQQRLRIDELTTHATQLANQLEDAQTAIALLSNRQPEFVYLPPGAGAITVPPLIAPGQQAPPPPPPPRMHDRTVGGFNSRQLGAGEELGFAAASAHPHTPHRARMFQTQREWRKKPPRRLVVHSTASSDESSPTEEILQEARRRLRRLEEESEAVDRSYRDFRLRHSESLAATASVLFHPVAYRDNPIFRLPTSQQSGNPPSFAFQPEYIRSRSTLRPNTIYEQVMNNTSSIPPVQTGRLSTFPLFSFSETNQPIPFSFESEQSHSLGRIFNPSPRLVPVNNSVGATAAGPFLYTNTMSNRSGIEGRERHSVLGTRLMTALHHVPPSVVSKSRRPHRVPQPSSSLNPESVTVVSSRHPMVSTTVYNTPQMSYLVDNSSGGRVEQNELQVRGSYTPPNSVQVTRWSTTLSEAPQFTRLPSPQGEIGPASNSPCVLPVPYVESHSPRMDIHLPEAIPTSKRKDDEGFKSSCSPNHQISTVGKAESSNSSMSPKILLSASTNISNNANANKMTLTSSISKSTTTSLEKGSKSHGDFTRTDMEFLPSTSVDVTVLKREGTPAHISSVDAMQNGKGTASTSYNDILSNISATREIEAHKSGEVTAINQIHELVTNENDEQNKQTQDTAASETTIGSLFVDLKDGDQLFHTSICPSETLSAVATSSILIPDVSLSSIDINSSDLPISAGEDSNKEDDDFW